MKWQWEMMSEKHPKQVHFPNYCPNLFFISNWLRFGLHKMFDTMKTFTQRLALALMMMFAWMYVDAQQLAFPGAEGFGKFAVGGRYGSVYRVTNLNDSGSGSLRDAVSQPNRIVVFDVAGVIKINSVLVFSSNLYIAGQTAPGEGITVYGNRVSFSGANNTICRYMKFRMGSIYGDSGKDACGISNGQNMIFDHVSVSWGRDETFSISWDGKGTEPTNITIQNSIIAQGLLAHSAGGLIQTNGGVTLYRNLYVDNDTRNNKIKGVNQYVNNIVYNWKSAAYIMGGDSEGTSYANCEGNLFIKGPANGSTPLSGANANFNIYAQDNWFDNNKNGAFDPYLVPYSEYSGGPTFQSQPFNYPLVPTISAGNLLAESLPTVGASLPCRDFVDYYVVNEVKSLGASGAIISSESELPFGSPNSWLLWPGTKRTDSDGDGMPDDWEDANALNKSSAADAMLIAANGYANIENYINGIDAASTQAYLRAPLSLRMSEADANSVTLEWFDYTEMEDGYIIERLVDASYAEIGRVGANVSSFKVPDLQPEEQGSYRVKAFNAAVESGYSNVLTCSAKPIPVSVIDPSTFVPDVSWTGATNGNWDLSTVNWQNPNAVAFADGNKVLFGNQGSSQTITLAETVSPSVTFVSADNDYTFSGIGVIAGTGSVNKTGNGKFALLTNNSYTGATVIHSGTLEINKLANGGLASSIGASANHEFNWVWNGGKIRYTGSTVVTDRNVALESATEFEVTNAAATVTIGGVIDGQGDFVKSGPGKVYSTFGKYTYTGNTIVNDGTYELNGNYASVGLLGKLILKGGRFKTSGGADGRDGIFSFPVEVNGENTSYFEPTRNSQINSRFSGSGNLQLDISYLREFYNGNWDNFYGNLILNAVGALTTNPQFMLSNETNGAGIPNARIIVNSGIVIMGGKSGATYSLGALSGVAGTTLACVHVKTDGGIMTWKIGGLGTDEEFKGSINNGISSTSRIGTTHIVKEGKGYWRLTGTNKYRGTTTINGGMLIVNGLHTTDKDYTNVPFTPANYTVNAGGTLAGKGTIATGVIVNSGATLSPGDFGVGTFSVASLTMQAGSSFVVDINKNTGLYDKLTVTGAATLGGTLKLNITGTLAEGNTFTIMSASSYAGQFAAFEPATPGEGLAWHFSNGVLSVVNAATPVKEQKRDLEVSVGPNPVKSVLTVSSSKGFGNATLYIRSLTGKMVLSQSIVGKQTVNVSVDGLSKGIYLLSIVNDGKQLPVTKVVKE
jgi:autotransporter-associated beta strand protein